MERGPILPAQSESLNVILDEQIKVARLALESADKNIKEIEALLTIIKGEGDDVTEDVKQVNARVLPTLEKALEDAKATKETLNTSLNTFYEIKLGSIDPESEQN
ncbi:MAG: hypothetical protein AB202_00780 [Parcubacteria bacterium C7867-007]|nr:MAG: hypothetical protein AB202_00780 [Parcubacteria bacterium C7867-007]